MSNHPSVGLVILNWNTKAITLRCAEVALKSSYENFELLIIDNGSSDGSGDFLKKKLGNRANYILNKSNLGYSAGFNKGLKYFIERDFDYVMVLNSDAFLSSDSISSLVDVCLNYNNVGFVTGKVFSLKKPEVLLSIGRKANWLTLVGNIVGINEKDVGQYNRVKKFPFIDDVYMLISSNLIKQVGYYDENFFIQFEEADLIARGAKKNFKAFYTPKAKAWHGVSVSTGGTASPKRYFHSFRNRIIFLSKHQKKSLFLLFMIWNILYLTPKFCFIFWSKRKYTISKGVLLGSISGLKFLINKEVNN